jgi:hypothetical protein
VKQLAPDLWTFDSPLSFLGLEIGARMSVVRLAGGKLVVHSPIRFSPELAREVDRLGEVAFLVAPNRFHHLFLAGWKEAYPSALVYVASGVEKKRPEVKIAGTLENGVDYGWSGELAHISLDGIPGTNEAVFFHHPSKTLITTDLVFNVNETSPPLTRAVFKMGGAFGHVGPTLLERILVREKPAFRRSLEAVLAFPFERIVMAHGEISERGGREEFTRGYSWVLEK